MKKIKPFFLTNSQSCAQALAFAHEEAQVYFLEKASKFGASIYEAEQLLNASIPNHLQKTHTLAIRESASNGWFVFHKKQQLSAEFDPYWLPIEDAQHCGLSVLEKPIRWLEINTELNKMLTADTHISLPTETIALDLLLSPLCTLWREEGRLHIDRPFTRQASLINLIALVETQLSDCSQYLGLADAALWIKLNETRPATEQAPLEMNFKEVAMADSNGHLRTILETHAVLICSDCEPLQRNGQLKAEFIDPSPSMIEALHSQGFQVSSSNLSLINASEMKKVATLYFDDLLHLLKTLPA